MTSISIYIIVFLVVAVVILATEVSALRNENKEYLGRRDKKDKPLQQAEPGIKHNGICLTCYFKNKCSVTERDIFRDDTKQVADCELYMKDIASKEVEKIGKTD